MSHALPSDDLSSLCTGMLPLITTIIMKKPELLHMHDRTFSISVCQQAKEGNGGQPRCAVRGLGEVWVSGNLPCS